MSIVMENANCFDFLPTLKNNSVDLVLIDPPYDILGGSWYKDRSHADDESFAEWDNELNILKLLTEMYRVLRSGGTLIMFYDLWKITTLKECLEISRFKQIRLIEWLKTNPVPLNGKLNYLTTAREIAITAVKKGKGTFNSQYDNGVYECGICREKDRFHPTQKPLKLIEQLILKHSRIGDIVLDCFFGSGTTAVACLRTDRNFIGCELSEEYYNKAKFRLEKHTSQNSNETLIKL